MVGETLHGLGPCARRADARHGPEPDAPYWGADVLKGWPYAAWVDSVYVHARPVPMTSTTTVRTGKSVRRSAHEVQQRKCAALTTSNHKLGSVQMNMNADNNWPQHWKCDHLRKLDDRKGMMGRSALSRAGAGVGIGRRGRHQRRALRITDKHRGVALWSQDLSSLQTGTLSAGSYIRPPLANFDTGRTAARATISRCYRAAGRNLPSTELGSHRDGRLHAARWTVTTIHIIAHGVRQINDSPCEAMSQIFGDKLQNAPPPAVDPSRPRA